MLFGYGPLDYQSVKIFLLEGTGLAKDALHVYAGLILYLGVRLCFRRRGGGILAWLVVLTAAVTGEYLDIKVEALDNGMQPDSAHWHDIWNTLFWPTVLLIVGRWLHPAPKPKSEPSDEFADQTLEETPPV